MPKHSVLIILLVLGLSVLTSCSTLRNRPAAGLPIHSQQVGLAVYQQIEVTYGNKYQRFEAAIEFLDKANMKLVLISELGQHLATIQLSDTKLTETNEGIFANPAPLKFLLPSFQYIFWPTEAWEQFFLYSKWRIIDRGLRREFYYDEVLASTVEYDSDCPWRGQIHYVDIINKYKLTVNSALLETNPSQIINETYCPI